jgi:hypothetical protein
MQVVAKQNDQLLYASWELVLLLHFKPLYVKLKVGYL